MTKTNKIVAFLAAFTLLTAGLVSTHNSSAAGVTVTVAPATQAVSTAANVVLTLTTTVAVPVGGTVQVTRPTAAYTGTATMAITGATGTTANTTSGTESISTFTVTGTTIAAGALTITMGGLTTAATPGNYSWKFYTSTGDWGANFQYVGQANVVAVRVRVPLTLTFDIRNATDTLGTNLCDMGDLSTAAVGFCEYRLKVSTNARSGYTINLATSGNFTNGTDNFANAAAGTGGTGGTNLVAGTEGYGARITGGAVTGAGGTVTLAAAYNAGVTNEVGYTATGPVVIVTSNRPNAPGATDLANTTLVRHEAAISASTPAGLYTQTVTYTIAPSF